MQGKFTRIVIIDDELLLRTGVRFLCDWQSEGFEIVGEASNGAEGMRMVRKLRPDIVITDIRMPEMDGIDLTAQIKQEFPDIAVLILSSYDNFHYVKTTFKYGAADYFLKSDLNAQTLLDALRKIKAPPAPAARKASAQFVLLNLLVREGETRASAEEAFRKAGIKFQPGPPFYLMAGSAASYDYTDAKKECAELEQRLSALPETGTLISSVSGDAVIYLLAQSSALPGRFYEALADCFTASAQENKRVFGITEPMADLSGLSAAAARARQVQEFRFYYPDALLITPAMITGEGVAMPTDSIARSLELLDTQPVEDLICSYIEKNAELHGIEPYLLKKNIQGQLYLAIQTIGRAGISIAELNQRKIRMFRRIDDSVNYQELTEAVRYSCGMIAETVREELSRRNQDVLAPVHEYVKQHCCEELRLSDVAAAVHLNYSYLSSLFRQKSNERFTDYLNRIRIERAKELMRTEYLPICEICGAVGFADQSYFSKVFRKYEKMSPSQYLKIYRKL